jgi:hypothetical protein
MGGALWDAQCGLNDACEANRIDGAIRISIIVIDNFQHAASTETSQRLGIGCLTCCMLFKRSRNRGGMQLRNMS